MSLLGDKIKASRGGPHYNSHDIEVGDETVTLYASALTGADIEWISRRHKDFAVNPTVGAQIDIIIHKVLVKDQSTGEMVKAFDQKDKPELMMQSLEWISEVRDNLFPADDADLSDEALEASEKN